VHIAPMVHEFGWRTDDWNLMGAAIAIGHIIECSSGCAGGMSNFWKDIKEPWRVAFPIAEVFENGDAVITKADGSGRMVTEWTVKEHLVYEVHDPTKYIMADGISDFSECQLSTVGPDRVKVTGFKGAKRPDTLKLCLGYEDGWIGESEISVCWPDAYEKAQFCEKFLRGRFEALKLPINEMRVDFIGLNSIHGPLAALPKNIDELNEVRVRVAVKTTTKESANLVRREVTHLWTHGPVGTTAVISPPPPRQVISLWPTLVPRELVPQTFVMKEVK
jgi:Acyclic terpene utilisation family protein AtuA